MIKKCDFSVNASDRRPMVRIDLCKDTFLIGLPGEASAAEQALLGKRSV
jgi:hypothetical protein